MLKNPILDFLSEPLLSDFGKIEREPIDQKSYYVIGGLTVKDQWNFNCMYSGEIFKIVNIQDSKTIIDFLTVLLEKMYFIDCGQDWWSTYDLTSTGVDLMPTIKKHFEPKYMLKAYEIILDDIKSKENEAEVAPYDCDLFKEYYSLLLNQS